MSRLINRLLPSVPVGPTSVSDLDHALAGALAGDALVGTQDPLAFVAFLRECWRPLTYRTTTLVDHGRAEGSRPEDNDAAAQAALRFETLLETLRTGVPAFSYASATRLARVADGLTGRREHFDRPRVAYDIAMHARSAATWTANGRFLAALVRFARSSRIVEIGTAYGMSSLFMATELVPDGTIATIEVSEPQRTLSRELLEKEEPHRVHTIHAWSHEAVDQVRNILGTATLLFHDGGHSGEAYVRDFDLYLPIMESGGIVLFDNIRWDNRLWAASDPKTYEGWLKVTQHPRVRMAVEIDDDYGLIQLT